MSAIFISEKSGFASRYVPTLALGFYLLLLVAEGAAIYAMVDTVSAHKDAVDDASAQLARFVALKSATPPPPPPQEFPADSAFLNGEKLSVASAELQRRVTSSVLRYEGTVLSSQVERQTPRGLATGVELGLEFDIDLVGLQQFLREIETTTPILFIDTISIVRRDGVDPGGVAPLLRVNARIGATWLDREGR